MAKDTKGRILEAALEVFARDGYEGANISDIASMVGIVKSALYRHFAGKEEIWNAVMDMMIDYYSARFGSPDRLPGIPASGDELYEMTIRLVDFTVHDRKVVLVRRLLQTEQFRDERARKLATRYFLTDTQEMFARVFAGMMERGAMKSVDPGMLSLAYTAPVTALIHLCDREPDGANEAVDRIRGYVGAFVAAYCLPVGAGGAAENE